MSGAVGRNGVLGLVARTFRGPPAAAAAAILERLAASPTGTFAALTYHRVDEPGRRPWLLPSLVSATPEGFEAQMRAVLRHHRPIGLPQLLAAQRGKQPLPHRAVLVTFDDAYRDFEENAWPTLKQLGIPATLFVPTGFPDAPDRSFWWDRLWQALGLASDELAETPIGALDLRTEAHRRAAARALIDHHKALPHDAAMASVESVIERLGGAGSGAVRATSRRAADPSGAGDVLGWADLRQLASSGVHMAVHSRTHPLLSRVDPARAEAEVLGARMDLERELGPLAFGSVFAYPSGHESPAARAALVKARFELGFGTVRGINRLGRTDPLRLRRINVGLRAGPELVRAQVAFFTLRYRLRGV